MYFKRFYDTDLAQASYMIGCQKTGECLVVDPVRDISQYLDEAKGHLSGKLQVRSVLCFCIPPARALADAHAPVLARQNPSVCRWMDLA